jgi:predicted SprT family Zn-dependent metalloprotease
MTVESDKTISNETADLYRMNTKDDNETNNITSKYMYQCKKCTSNFKSISSLKHHELSHTKARPFRCFV